jgi:hypothetical protein
MAWCSGPVPTLRLVPQMCARPHGEHGLGLQPQRAHPGTAPKLLKAHSAPSTSAAPEAHVPSALAGGAAGAGNPAKAWPARAQRRRD